MPEIKHTFQGGKMNKDLDERLVPNGEYRDAMNVQVRTTDGEAAGTVQNLKGNYTEIENIGDGIHMGGYITQDNTPSECVAAIADEKSDKSYWFFASSSPSGANKYTQWSSQRKSIDTIVEHNSNGETLIVFSDVWQVIQTVDVAIIPENVTSSETAGELGSLTSDIFTVNQSGLGNSAFGQITELQITKECYDFVRPGMEVRAYQSIENEDGEQVDSNDLLSNNNPIIKDKVIEETIVDDETVYTYKILFHESHNSSDFEGATHLVFKISKVLQFSTRAVSFISTNIIDNLLFWTDGVYEPKVINIDKCKAGSDIDFTHTKLMVNNPASTSNAIVSIDTLANNLGSDPIHKWVELKDITVIKKAPTKAPILKMKSELRSNAQDILFNYNFVTSEQTVLATGEIEIIEDNNFTTSNFRKDDILIIEQQDAGIPIIIKAKFISYVNDDGEDVLEITNTIKIKILSVSDNITIAETFTDWSISLEQRKPLFERKMVRFGYRYKYDDGEYSSFSPWSELAFLPDTFDYNSKDAYNLGMVNNVRQLTIENFIPYKRSAKIKEVDILYKATDSAVVYVAATVCRTKDDEWELFTPDGVDTADGGDGIIKQGQLSITSEMVHRALPSSQLLRGWDNVPRKALAQEITGNRLVFANYVQGYNITNSINLLQEIISKTPSSFPQKSIKSIRDYKIGMVFGDKYGRETPVINSGYSMELTEGSEATSGDLSIEKTLCAMANRFKLTIDWDNPPPWLTSGGYFKYYIKETSNEYYNLVMDKWYNSGDGTLWLSFNSADRNKVDEETYLLLKNRNGSNEPVLEKARYKIISIKNEAPDFIKTTYYNIGLIKENVDPSGVLGIWSGDNVETEPPEGFWDSERSMTITNSTWNGGTAGYISGDDTASSPVFGREIKGHVEMQVIGKVGNLVQRSQWRRISHWTRTGSDVQLNWQEPFSSNATGGANMFQAFNCPACTGLTYELAFREALVENKPEFDGKFFVKINKDEVLNQEVIQGTYQYDTVGEIQISYIESDAMNQSARPMASGIDAEALFNGNGWFYGSFDSVFTNYDGDGDNWDNLNFGNATWNSTNGAGQLNILSGGDGFYTADSLFNSGDVVAENILGASMGDRPQTNIANLMGNQGNNWYVYDGEGFPEEVNDLDNHDSRGHTLNWNFDPYTYTGFTLNAAADNINSVNGFPYPHKWNWNYFGGSSSSDINNQWSWGMVNKQHPQWWGNNIPRQLGDGSEGDPLVSGPSIMGQLCGPLPYTAPQGFGPGIDYYENNNVKQYRDATKDFWDNYAQNNGRFFIDGSGSRRQYANLPDYSTIGIRYSAIEDDAWDGLPSANDNFASNYPDRMQDGVWSDELVENGQGYVDFYKGYGLDAGLYPNAISDTNGAQNGTLGRMMLSVPKVSYDANIYTINTLQNNAMFIFANAPLDVDGLPIIYRVVHAERLAIGSMYSKDGTDNFDSGQAPSGGPDGTTVVPPTFGDNGYLYMGEAGTPSRNQRYLGFKCEPDTSNDALKLMTSIEFRKVDRATNSTMDVGLDVSSENGFDPRSHLFHDGRNYISLLIVDYGDEVDVDGNSINNDLGACWETEPKESVDVDLYYEASNAMPMVLNNENAFNHIPVNSKVTVTRELNNEIENISLQGLNHVVNNLHFINNKTIVSIVKDSDNGPVLHNQNILIGDTLTFEHNDGTKTSTKVLDYAKPISGQSTIHGVLNNQEAISGVVDNPRAFALGETQDINLIWSSDINGDYNNLVLLVENDSFVGSLVGANINSITQSFTSDANIQTQSSLTSNSFNTNGWFITNVLNFEDIADVTADDFINPFPGYSAVSISNIGEGGVINGSNIITPFALSFNPDCANITNSPQGLDNYPCFDQSVYDNNPSLDNVGSIPILLAPASTEGAATGLDISININSRYGYYVVDPEVWKYPIELSWFNCYTFGNGVESDRVRDDFNAPQIDNGIRVSTTFSGYGEENKSSGMIYSGLYNSTSEVNDLSEFNMSEKITKDLNPSYGSIQRLKTRDTDLVVLAEDKVLKVLANKDAVFNADGNPQLTATNRVLGQAIPFVGDYGISTAPESLASDQYRLYFADTQRGAVLRLSRDGLTPISNVGMKTWFRENISKIRPNTLLGTFDGVNGEYNLTLKYGSNSGYNNKTISFNEASKGWVSFKSFIPTKGVYISGKYYTSNSGRIYEHYSDNVDYNTFYGDMVDSYIDVVFNEIPSVVKSFRTLNYEGSQARVTQNTEDDQYYNLVGKEGWWASNVETDLQSGSDIEFKDKENKWFNYFKGSETSLSNLDTKEFSVQGLGMISVVGGDSIVMGCMDESSFNYDSLANYNVASDCCYVEGCTFEGHLNYDPEACFDDGSCIQYILGCDDLTTSGPYPDVYGNGNPAVMGSVDGDISCPYPCQVEIAGSIFYMGYASFGVDPNANTLSPSLCYQPTGCMNPNASNYDASLISQFNPGAFSFNNINSSTIFFEDESACTYVYGCTDPIASNYDPLAVFEESPSNCTYVEGCTDSTAFNYNPSAVIDNGTCIPFIYGCQDINALNYNPSANASDITNYPCEYAVFGCTDPTAINYDSNANSDDGTCMYEEADTLFGVINFPDDSEADILPSEDNLNE